MSNEKLIKKLLIKPGYRLLVLNAPASFLESLKPLPDGCELSLQARGAFELVHLFAQNSGELQEHAPVAIKALKKDGIFWISYPKKSSKVETDLTRDQGWQVVTGNGWRGVTQVSIDSTWSAVRFRPADPSTPQDLIDAQFKGPKAALRPLYDEVIRYLQGLGSDVKIAPRKSYVALLRNKTFALLKASTRDRLDVGLKLPVYEATERLQESGGWGSGSITHKVGLHEMSDVDDELRAWLRAAYDTVG